MKQTPNMFSFGTLQSSKVTVAVEDPLMPIIVIIIVVIIIIIIIVCCYYQVCLPSFRETNQEFSYQ